MLRKSALFLLVVLVALGGTAYAQQKQASLAEIVKAAEKEGEVLWTSTYKDDEVVPFIKAFNKDYPKIKLVHEREHGAEAMERLLRELMSGVPVNDVVLLHTDSVNQFLEMDVLESADWKIFNVVPQLVTENNRLVSTTSMAYIIVYNTKLLKKEEAPKTWDEFLDPKWKGKFIVDSRPNTFLCLTGGWGQAKVLDFAKKLGQNSPTFVRGQTEAMNLMAAGQYMLSAGAMISSAQYVMQKGGPLAYNLPDPIPMHLQPSAVLKKAPHPNAAKVFLGWLGSKGYKIWDEINPGRGVPFGGTLLDKEFKGKRFSSPLSRAVLPDSQGFEKQVMQALGVLKK
jgi:iron(III) transport system substrate-binding protein